MATGGREERLTRRNLDKEVQELKEKRQRLVEMRSALKIPKGKDSGLTIQQPLPQAESEHLETEVIDKQSLPPISVSTQHVGDRNEEEEYSPHKPASVFNGTIEYDDFLESTRRTLEKTKQRISRTPSHITIDEYRDITPPEKEKQSTQSERRDHIDKARDELQEREKHLQVRLQRLAHNEHIQKEREGKMRDYLREKDQEFDRKKKELYANFQDREMALITQEKRINELERTMTQKMSRIEQRLEQKDQQLAEKEEVLRKREGEIEKLAKQTQQRLNIKEDDYYFERSRTQRHVKQEMKEEEEEDYLYELDRQIAALEKEKTQVDSDDTHREFKRKEVMVDNINIKLNISSFSGTTPVPKNEVMIEDLKLEVESLQTIYSDNVVKQSLRKSLRGQAKRIMLHMNNTATVDEIMAELEDNFGNVASSDTVLTRFLTAEQNQSESIVDWGLRLEDLMMQVDRKSNIGPTERKTMIRNRFWRGLKNEELKAATRVQFESSMPYAELRNKVREEEYEIQLTNEKGAKPKTAKLHQTAAESNGDSSLLKELMTKVEELGQKFEDLQKEHHEGKDTSDTYYTEPFRNSRGRYRGGYRGYRGNRRGSSSLRRDGQTYRNPLPDQQTTDKKADENLNG